MTPMELSAAGPAAAPPPAPPPAGPPAAPAPAYAVPSARLNPISLAALCALLVIALDLDLAPAGDTVASSPLFATAGPGTDSVAPPSSPSSSSSSSSSASAASASATTAAAAARGPVALPSAEDSAAAATVAWGSLVDLVVYINAASNPARDEAMQRDFLPAFQSSSPRGEAPAPDVVRLDAFKADEGMPSIQGAALSHISALQLALDAGCRNVLVLEDDSLWRVSPGRQNLLLLEDLVAAPYDVILLGGTFVQQDEATHRLRHAYSTNAYIVKDAYIPTLLENFAEGLHFLTEQPSVKMYSIDVWWNRLIQVSAFYIVWPPLVIQDHNAQGYGYPLSNDTRFNFQLTQLAGRLR